MGVRSLPKGGGGDLNKKVSPKSVCSTKMIKNMRDEGEKPLKLGLGASLRRNVGFLH